MSKNLKCDKCGTQHDTTNSVDTIPDHGKLIKCKCGNGLHILKSDSYYKNTYSKEIATYILHNKHNKHNKHNQSAINLKASIKRLAGAEKYFSAKKVKLLDITEVNSNRFISDILQKFGQSQADGFASTLFEFFNVLIEHGLASKNPFVNIDRSDVPVGDGESSADNTEKMKDAIDNIPHIINKNNAPAKLNNAAKNNNYPDAIPVGAVLIDQYRIEKVLGQGGFGLTYLATDIRLNMLVAIKEFFPSEISLRSNGLDASAKSRFHRKQFKRGLTQFLDEARALAHFHHQNIVQVNNFFKTNGTAYIVMCYEKGASLDAILKRKKILPESQLMQIIMPLLDGLEELHDAGFVHRDIKPGNIYIRDKDGSPVLLDFGSTRLAVGDKAKTVTVMLTPGYAPLEQYDANSKRQGPWTDIYSLGAVLYRCVGGDIPADSTKRSIAILHAEPDPMLPASDISDNHSKEFLSAIDWAMQVLEEDRPQSIAQWKESLESTYEIEFMVKPKRRSHNKLVVLVTMLFLLGVGGTLSNMILQEATFSSIAQDEPVKSIEVSEKADGLQKLEQKQEMTGRHESKAVLKQAQQEKELARVQRLRESEAKQAEAEMLGRAKNLQQLAQKQEKAEKQARQKEELTRKQRLRDDEAKQTEILAKLQAQEAQRHAELVSARKQELARQAKNKQTVQAPMEKPPWTDLVTRMDFVWVRGGCFQMGNNSGASDEAPIHEVCVDGIWMGKYEVTIAQFAIFKNETGYVGTRITDWQCKVMGEVDGLNQTEQHPISCVTWNDVKAFADWMTKKSRLNYRMPTEAEWEYVCRDGGQNQQYCGGDDLDALGWYSGNSEKVPHPVGEKQKNSLGLYDMTGNVWEWVQDRYDSGYYAKSPKLNPKGATALDRVYRGGSWLGGSEDVRSTLRNRYIPSFRFRGVGARLVRQP